MRLTVRRLFESLSLYLENGATMCYNKQNYCCIQDFFILQRRFGDM